MRSTTVTLSETSRRQSWLPRDFLYEPGRRIKVGGRRGVVVAQDGRTVRVSFIECVPGSSTPFACSLPTTVGVFDIDLDHAR